MGGRLPIARWSSVLRKFSHRKSVVFSSICSTHIGVLIVLSTPVAFFP